jgi:uncharacterized protein (DUF1800 family)
MLTRFGALTCVLACLSAGLWVPSASAATLPSFAGSSSGSVTALTITAHITVRDVDAGKNGQIYVALVTSGDAYLLDHAGVLHRYVGGALPAFSSGILRSQSIALVSGVNWSAWSCAQLIVGYGANETDLVQNHLYGAILTIPSSTSTAAIPACSVSLDADITRFLRQSSFGPTFATIERVRQIGIPAFIDEQFSTPISGYPEYPYAAIIQPPDCMPEPANPKGPSHACWEENYSSRKMTRVFFTNALTQPDQLRQRVALALSQIWVVSDISLYGIADYQQLLMHHAFGNYRDIMEAVTLSPAMGDYQDLVNNDKPNPSRGTQPNENYAREFLQLFTIGPVMLNIDGTPQLAPNGQAVPSYGQPEVIGFAHVFTGWTYPINPYVPFSGDFYRPYYLRGPMISSEAHHDTGPKTLLNGTTLPPGQSAVLDLRQALDNVFAHPNVGPFIGKQLIQHLVTGDPDPAYVARIARVFNDNGAGGRGDMKAVVKAILLDPEARGDRKSSPTYGKLKEPLYQVTEILRALNGATDGDAPGWVASDLNQPPFRPESVFSFYPPDYLLPGVGTVAPTFAIYNTASVMSRINAVITLTGPASPPGWTPAFPAGYRPDLNTTLPTSGTHLDWTLLARGDDPNVSEAVVDFLNYMFLDGNMTPSMRTVLLQKGAAIKPGQWYERTRAYLVMLFSSPQFQIQR